MSRAGVAVLAAPLTPDDFAALMMPFAPFERGPHLAVAVSGGGDSMALLLLADDWARAQGGRVTALTVDHGLRAEAAAEAAQVARWCSARGIEHVTLTRAGPMPQSGLQAMARDARYRLLEGWCRDHGVLHLLLAHQRDDQAETVAIRDAAHSGIDGLAGMASISERGAVRLLRPLLSMTRTTLRDFLDACGQGWIEDPSNRNRAFTRVRMRDALGEAPAASVLAHLGSTGTRLGRVRAAREAEDAQGLARWLTLHPAGFAWLDPAAVAGSDALGGKALGAILATVSGSAYPPRSERIERLKLDLTEGLRQGRTLGGCLVVRRHGKILICREPAPVAPPVPIPAGAAVHWDGRFLATLDPVAGGGFWVGALGQDAAAVAREAPKTALAAVPFAARAGLPALRDAKGVVAVPALEYFKRYREGASGAACRLQFRPIRPLTGAGFTIV
jgi:tRNA(Ile)-lysidine synthase